MLHMLASAAVLAASPPLVTVSKTLLKPFPREGAASWINDRYTGAGLTRMEVHSTEVEGKDDVYLMRYARWSRDNGRTWLPAEKIADTERRAAGRSVWEGGGAEIYDPASKALVRLWLRQIQKDGQYHCFTYWQMSRDEGRSWSTPQQICYEPKVEFNEADPHSPAFLAVNQGYFGNRIERLRNGRLAFVLAHTNAAGDPENFRRPWRMGSILFIGGWQADRGTYAFLPMARVEASPQQSGRGLMEPDIAELKDGRLLVVWRQDSTPQTPGCKLFSISTDGGRTLSSPRPWQYSDGVGFYSPSSFHAFLRHTRTGKLYWIGNITPKPPFRNSPRYPLVIAEVDEQKAALKRETVTVIDDRSPGQSNRLQLSNFSVLENRRTGEIELKMGVIGAYEGRSVYTGDAYHYRLRLTELPNSAEKPLPRWKVGLARADITPRAPVWMSGYAGRRISTGVRHPLWAKALAMEDAGGMRAVLVTSDLIGFSGEAYERIRSAAERRFGLRQEQLLLSFSHTHTGPVLAGSLLDYYPLDAAGEAATARYSTWLESEIVDLIGRALDDRRDAILETTFDSTDFAVNRRENREPEVPAVRSRNEALKGPTDPAVPVMLVRDADKGTLRALVFGYACHATTMADTELSGDYPGYAQQLLEAERPGLQAMFWAGCGADLNPLPRRTVELCREYGHRLAEAVARAISRPADQLKPQLETACATLSLPYENVVSDAQLEKERGAEGLRGRWAARLLQRRAAGDPTARSADYPYPIVMWRLGGSRLLVALAGEVVVDYALWLKKRFGDTVWAMAYVNDLVAYIPSRRILHEGGYEANGVYEYGHPAERWDAGIESRITAAVEKLYARLKR
jgi:hypothetical protein